MRTSIALVMALLLASAAAVGQGITSTPKPAAPRTALPPAPPPPPPAAPRQSTAAPEARSDTNIRIDVTVVDDGGSQTVRKTVTLTSVDGLRVSSRSETPLVPLPGGVMKPNAALNIDATPMLVSNGRIRVRIVLRYDAAPMAEGTQERPTGLNLDLPLVVESGKKIVASQTSDPVSDRRVTVEVTATVIK